MTTTSTAPRQTAKAPTARRSFIERWLAIIFLGPTLLGMALFTFLGQISDEAGLMPLAGSSSTISSAITCSTRAVLSSLMPE